MYCVLTSYSVTGVAGQDGKGVRLVGKRGTGKMPDMGTDTRVYGSTITYHHCRRILERDELLHNHVMT